LCGLRAYASFRGPEGEASMSKRRLLCVLLAGAALAAPLAAHAGVDPIPYQRFVLDNGLTLIVHEDHKAPIVAVNVWYHVGSKNEQPGKTGFAHLFEHLMFQGSEHANDEYFKVFDRVGATEINGTTDSDRTNYFQNVPSSALDVALFMESDRMGHLLGVIDQARLDEQRGVVKNEKRQGEDQPYGNVYRVLVENAYPAGHPYSWSTIGSMDDLDAATLADVREWFRRWYGAANAVIVVAGDVDANEVLEKTQRYFGDIPPGPPLTRPGPWVAKRTSSQRVVLEERVPQARLIKAWNVPPWGSADGDRLALAAAVLGAGKTSRLHRRLVHEEQLATEVEAFAWLREIGGLFVVELTAQPGQDLVALERALDEEVARLLADGPTREELARVQAEERAAFLRGIEKVGGFGGKSDVLAESEVLGGSPDAYRRTLARRQSASPSEVRDAARRWLDGGTTVLEVRPAASHAASAQGVDRSRLPAPGAPPEPRFPELARTRLGNGLELIVAERRGVPLVRFELLVDAGYAADHDETAGLAKLALELMPEGTRKQDGLEIAESLALLGAKLETRSNLDLSVLSLSALRENLDASLAIFADVIQHPAFAPADVERLRKLQLAAIEQEQQRPLQLALRLFPRLLYGEGHPYARPLTGSGTPESVAKISREDLAGFHRAWFRPDRATLVVAGDTSLAEIAPKLEALFERWRPPASDAASEAPRKTFPPPAPMPPAVYLIDRPGAQQSLIVVGNLAPAKSDPRELALEAFHELLGGSFSGRINMNLRERKHWSYGAYSALLDARGERPFIVYAPVQTDRTAQAMAEIRREIRDALGPRPPTADELASTQDQATLTLPGRWETAAAVAGDVGTLVRFDLPDDYWSSYAARVRALGLPQVAAAGRALVAPERLVWLVVGDRAAIEPGIRKLGLGELHLLDASGRPLAAPAPGAAGAPAR
jgi:zinc protease